jgi:uncharacterized protein (DUF362 family)
LTHTMLSDARVAVASTPAAAYSVEPEQIEDCLSRVARLLGWSSQSRGPFGNVIPRDSRVLVKPNLVLHQNQGSGGLDPLVTHPSVVRAVVGAVLLADPAEVLLGDAPLQGCDFDRLLHVTGLGGWADRLTNRDPRFKGIRDFRRTTCVFVNGVRVPSERLQPAERFVLFDLGSKSLLEPITVGRNVFRVTCYDPRLLAETHAPGRHQYLVAKEALEADVVVNLPKLKTHKKAGITGALKNLVGINGNKEYLPHHRPGGSDMGGDCYPRSSLIKRLIEYAADRENTTASQAAAGIWHGIGKQLDRVSRRLNRDQLGVEGSWSGNDTVWRMCVDLNRILLYGQPNGVLGSQPARQVLHIADAIIAGQGDGPLSPQPLPLGLILAGNNAAAMDWVGSEMLGYDPRRVAIVREAFGDFPWPLASFAPDQIELLGNWHPGNADQAFLHPAGWRDAARTFIS